MADRCSTPTRMKKEDKATQEGANQAKARTTKGNLVNLTSTIIKMLQMRQVDC